MPRSVTGFLMVSLTVLAVLAVASRIGPVARIVGLQTTTPTLVQ